MSKVFVEDMVISQSSISTTLPAQFCALPWATFHESAGGDVPQGLVLGQGRLGVRLLCGWLHWTALQSGDVTGEVTTAVMSRRALCFVRVGLVYGFFGVGFFIGLLLPSQRLSNKSL